MQRAPVSAHLEVDLGRKGKKEWRGIPAQIEGSNLWCESQLEPPSPEPERTRPAGAPCCLGQRGPGEGGRRGFGRNAWGGMDSTHSARRPDFRPPLRGEVATCPPSRPAVCGTRATGGLHCAPLDR
ncbi:hypothetical protein P7K49_024446, partial [Saguinus oedipus]